MVMDYFPGGIRSSDHNTGYSHLANGVLNAIDLSNGVVHWTVELEGWIVAATDRQVVVLTRTKAETLTVLDSLTGDRVGWYDFDDLPEVFLEFLEKPDGIEFKAQSNSPEVSLTWSGQIKYAGGASPNDFAETTPMEAGGVILNLKDRTVTEITNSQDIQDTEIPNNLDIGSVGNSGIEDFSNSSNDKESVNIKYEFKTEAGTADKQRIKIIASNEEDGTQLWEADLGEINIQKQASALRGRMKP